MPSSPRSRRSTRPAPTTPRVETGIGQPLPLPHERDQATGHTDPAPTDVIKQAKRDLDAGLVDTDMRATPGLDAQRRDRLVPGPRRR